MPRSFSRRRHPLAALAVPVLLALMACARTPPETAAPPSSGFPPELVDWVPYEGNPLFTGTGTHTWDRMIRERGFVLRDGATWKLWYTGYDTDPAETMRLGYATSPDGLRWTRHPGNPVFDETWTEDVHVTKRDGVYVLFAEGRNDIAHLLTSTDGVRWEEEGRLDPDPLGGAALARSLRHAHRVGRGRDLVPLLRARRRGHLARDVGRPARLAQPRATPP